MKKRITKIWGVGLTIVLAASLLLAAAPTSAGTLSWGDEDLPDEIEAGNITDVAVFPGGGVIYAAHDSGSVFRSTNVGKSWSSITVITDSAVLLPALVAVAPDDENYIAAVAANATVYISDDAGANWDTLGLITLLNGRVRDIALSPEKGGKHTVAVCGANATAASVYTYEIGAIGAAWVQISDPVVDPGFATADVAGAIAFSPNFASDEVLVAVTADLTTIFQLQIYSFNQDNWNTGTFADYPAEIVAVSGDAAVDVLDSASIALAPDYLGSDDAMRILFIGTTANSGASADEGSGIFRMDDDDVEELKVKQFIHSVAFDGTRLVAGHYDSTNIRRSADPLGSSPTVSGVTSTKRPGGQSKTVVAFGGDDVVAGTAGEESAFSVSRDDGATFNDISLIDTTLEKLSDVIVSSDGSKVYLVSANDTAGTPNLSVWRLASDWERIFVDLDVDDDYIVRMAPDDSDVIYLADVGETTLYYTSDGGEGKWHTRVSRYTIADLAVEGDGDVVYVLVKDTVAAHVSKSTNSGFTWASKVSHKISDGANMILSLGEDKLLVAGDGKVSYSTDGNVSWTKLSDGMPDNEDVQAVATGLNDGDFVIAGTSDNTGDYIYQWEIGEDDEYEKITDDGDIPVGYAVYGLALWEGALYAVAENTTATANASLMLRTLSPTSDDPSWSTAASPGEVFNAAPSALKASAGSDITKLWAIDTLGAQLFSYKDTLAVAVIELLSPADGFTLGVNPISGDSEHVIFTWESPSDKVTRFDFEIATDSGFNKDVLSLDYLKSSGTWDEGDVISQIVGPGAGGDGDIKFMAETTYYWRVRVDLAGPLRSAYSETRSFRTEALPVVPAPPVVIEQPPPPVISVPAAPSITITPPEIVLPPAPAPPPEIVIPPAPAPPAPITPAYIWAIIIIGAILVIAVVVLIIRTRRPV